MDSYLLPGSLYGSPSIILSLALETVFSSYKEEFQSYWIKAHSADLFTLNLHFKDYVSKHILRYWGLRLQHMDLGEHSSAHNMY